jgi:glycosyltransferase involved in cell wall biosynthesis
MHIAIDAAPLGEQRKTGVAQYTSHILKELSILDPVNEYALFGIPCKGKVIDFESRNFKAKGLPCRSILSLHWYIWTFWYYTGFSCQLKADNPDLFISTYPSMPPYFNCPGIVFIYDLTPLSIKYGHRADFKLRFRLQVTNAVKRASHIVTISQSTKNEIVKYFGINPQKIDIIFPGFDSEVFKPGQDVNHIEQVKRAFGIDGSYILYIGTLEPKKNVIRLVDAFCQLKKQKGISEKLVLAGKRGWNEVEIFDQIMRSGMENEVIYTGYVPDAEVPFLMSGAEVFVFPSLHEGFGIPPLEAMACGIPVIVSNTSSLPEVVGDAGMLVDPCSVDSISEAMYRVIVDVGLREEMRRKGLERCQLFSWERSAQDLLNVINRHSAK